MTFCPHCDFMNSERDTHCASCGSPLKNQPVELDQKAPTQPPPRSYVERNTIVGCCLLSLLLFFFPLLTIHIPITGDQDVTGYDVVSKLNDFRKKLKPPGASSIDKMSSSSDLPLSLRFAWLISVFLVGAFLYAAVALISAFKSVKFSGMASALGAGCSAAAILHITIMNSDIHSWLLEHAQAMQSDLKDNPFAGLAENVGALVVNALQIKPGWGVYALLVLLGLAALLGFSRVLSRLRLAPAGF